MKKNTGKRMKKVIITTAVAAVLLVAGVSAYAVGNGSGGAGISEQEAKRIALAEISGASESDITKFRKSYDDGKEEYEVEILYGGYEYDFEISAATGRIVDRSTEQVKTAEATANNTAPAAATAPAASVTVPVATPDESLAGNPADAARTTQNTQDAQNLQNTAASVPSADIGLEAAKNTALQQVPGASGSHIVKAHADYDDGRLEYDIEIHYNGYEYEFEIDGATGQIRDSDIEAMDYDNGAYWD